MKIDLIEQLGGYESAKRYTESRSGADNTFIFDSLNKALLQYRIERNIFEAGDYALRNDGFFNVIQVYAVENNIAECVRYVDGDARWSTFNFDELRHATPEEIKAGRRLEVCGG